MTQNFHPPRRTSDSANCDELEIDREKKKEVARKCQESFKLHSEAYSIMRGK